ncbi:hypothetical protein LEP1GSC073_0064 [Leptospira noguchii str. Cascata]|nr:hypothetical protein LEP1GSC073_0064 [Leptospira noguchii str. Cascata]
MKKYVVVPEKESEWRLTQIKWFAIGKCQKQNHRKESRNHVKAGENETRRKLKTKESR